MTTPIPEQSTQKPLGILFMAYGGAMKWRTKAGDEMAARLGEPLTKDLTAQAWRTALDPEGEWVRMDSQAFATPGHGGTVHTGLADVHGDIGIGLQTMVAINAGA